MTEKLTKLERAFFFGQRISAATSLPIEVRDALNDNNISIAKVLREGLYYLILEGRIKLPGYNGEQEEERK